MFINKDNQKQNKNNNQNYKITFKKNKEGKIIFYRKSIYFLKILSLIFFILLLITNKVYASSPKMVSKIYDSFSKIQKYITRVSTPIAGAALGTGLLMRKFSFGDEERVRRSKKLIRDTAVAYALILCLDLILSFIETLAK